MRILILLMVLSFGVHVTIVAKKETSKIKLSKIQTKKMKASLTEKDYDFMRIAQTLSANNSTVQHDHGTLTGSLIVKEDKIVGKGWDKSKLLTDPSAHAELEAVKEACNYLGGKSLKGCVLYTSAQPCPMCLSLLYMTEIDKIFYYVPANRLEKTDDELLSQHVYQTLMKDPSERSTPEMMLHQTEMEK